MAEAYKGPCQRQLIQGASHYNVVGKKYRQQVLRIILPQLERWRADLPAGPGPEQVDR